MHREGIDKYVCECEYPLQAVEAYNSVPMGTNQNDDEWMACKTANNKRLYQENGTSADQRERWGRQSQSRENNKEEESDSAQWEMIE